ncbi:hypothetical protein AGMMS49965_21320 [Bacteroidia bacterium]|nr:hypothetical protein AGMMS49965_21320 [Bacteroidia bacterium]
MLVIKIPFKDTEYTFSKKGKGKEKSKDSVTPVVSESNTEKKESVVAETEKVEEVVPIEVEDVADSDAEGAQTYVIKNKTYFYEVSRPDVCNKTKAYLVPGDVVTIDPDPDLRIFGYVQATYTNAKGKVTEGWIDPEDVNGLE